MRKRGLFGAVALVWALSVQSANAANWRSVRLEDEFTDVQTCRVEPGGAFGREFYRTMTGTFRTLHFFAENRNGEIRAGFMSEPLLPIPGDIQVRVDQNPLVTLSAADAPVDSAPSFQLPETPGLTPEARMAMEQSIRSSMALASPYRVLTGERALDLLRQVVAGETIIFRVVTINAAASHTGTIRPRGLSDALAECGITL